MTRRYREAAATLAALADDDLRLVDQAVRLPTLEGGTHQAVVVQQGKIVTALGVLQSTLRKRRVL